MIILPPLPYDKNSLEPYISSNTLDFHYDKHHSGYVKKLNEIIQNTQFENMSLMDIVNKSYNKSEFVDIFRNAAQAWNHTFYWHSMKPIGHSDDEDSMDSSLLEKINEDFGNIQSLKDELTKAALTQFASGWAWLVLNKEKYKLEIVKTSNENNPSLDKIYVPLLTIDVWEHAYYLDYQNQRLNYVKAIVNNLLNWAFASDNFVMAQQL